MARKVIAQRKSHTKGAGEKPSHYHVEYELHIGRDRKSMRLLNKETRKRVPIWKTMGDRYHSLGLFVWPADGQGVCYLMEDEIVREV